MNTMKLMNFEYLFSLDISDREQNRRIIMKILKMRTLLLTLLAIGTIDAFASGDDGLNYEELSLTNKELEIAVTGGNFQCNTWLQTDGSALASYTLKIEQLGKELESVEVSTLSTDCNQMKKISIMAKNGKKIKSKAMFRLYKITPSDGWGNPLPKEAYHACVTFIEIENLIGLDAWYWNPKDISACM